ncbi:MAG: VWA domain-containing protein, partial [Candidatus Njordarchaeota archaeon]
MKKLPSISEEFREVPGDYSSLAEDIKKKRKRREILKTRLFSHLKLALPFSSRMRFQPDKEFVSHTRVKTEKFGLARVPLKKMLFPRSSPLTVKGLLKKETEESTERIRFSIRERTRRQGNGEYYGLSGTSLYGRRGYYVTYIEPKHVIRDIAIIPTILTAVKTHPTSKRVFPEDIKIKLRAGKKRLLIIIVLDASDSMKSFVPIIMRAMLKFHKIAWKMRNLVGLISCYENNAKILTYPTTNINKIVRGLLSVEFSGKTPLALGLLKAHRLLISQKIKHPEAIPRILLISDGLANVPLSKPVDKNMREIIFSEAQADVLAIAKLLARRKIKIIAVNPWHIERWDSKL